ncbi:Thymidylate kinase [Camellia lanceoleosa]|nr:Thymidylate kinase [Camellia lanceoleosa]
MGLLAADLVLYLEIPPEKAAEREGYGGERYEQLDASWKSQKKLYEKHHNTADGRIRIWLGIRQIMNSTDCLLTETRDTAKELKTGIHIARCYARLHPRAVNCRTKNFRPKKKIK